MNEENFENRIEKRWEEIGKRRSEGRLLAGALLFIIGGLLLLNTLNIILFPNWFFTWPMLLIVFGLFTGIRHSFRGGFWIMLMLVGGLFLMNKIDPTLNLNRFIAPVIIMGIGLAFLLRPKSRHFSRCGPYDRRAWRRGEQAAVTEADKFAPAEADRRDFIDVTAIFGGVKKNVLSKNFKGGDIVSFMGGSEIDLTQADFQGKVKIDTTNIFGGTKLIVPSNWDVQSDMVAIFGGVDDKRQVSGVSIDHNKVLVLDGTCMFGGIEIRSF